MSAEIFLLRFCNSCLADFYLYLLDIIHRAFVLNFNFKVRNSRNDRIQFLLQFELEFVFELNEEAAHLSAHNFSHLPYSDNFVRLAFFVAN